MFENQKITHTRRVKLFSAGVVLLFIGQSICEAQPPFNPLNPAGIPPGPANQPVPPGFIPPAVAPVINYRESYQGELHLEISENALKMLLAREDTSSGPIQDFVDGAAVNGTQTTQTSTDVDIQPDQQNAKFNFVISGNVESTTTARTAQAEILQEGMSTFQGTKSVMLNGEEILTSKAIIQVMPNQRVLNARSLQGRMPIIGRLADQLAYNIAVNRTQQSNIVAGQKILNRVQPKIDTEIDRNLSQTNQLLKQQVWQRLRDWNIEPHYKNTMSSADRIYWDYQIGNTNIPYPEQPLLPDLSQSINPQIPAPVSDDVEILIHESLFATVASKRSLAGKTVSINEIQAATDQLLTLFAEEIAEPSQELPIAIDFVFANENPLRARFEEGYLNLQMRGKFKAGNLPSTETQRINLKITAEMNNDSVLFKTMNVDVLEEDPNGTTKTPGLTQTAIATQLRSQLKPIRLSRSTPLPAEKFQGTEIKLADLDSGNGWLIVKLEVTKAQIQPIPQAPFIAPQAPILGPTFAPTP